MASHELSVYRREPTLQEIADASANIDRIVREIGAVRSDIQSLQQQVRILHKTEHELTALANIQEGVITLARRIPPELLALIFEHCVQGGWTRAPIVLSHVCSQWRTAAQDPRVWSSIYINLDDPHHIMRTKLWLRMSHPAPLNISLNGEALVRLKNIEETVSLLTNHADQWSTLELALEAVQGTQAVISRLLPISSFPNLRSISILTTGNDPDAEAEVLDTLALAEVLTPKRAPSLRHLMVQLSIPPSHFSLPSHLRSLRIILLAQWDGVASLSATTLMNVLNPLTHLETLDLSLPLSAIQPFMTSPGDVIILGRVKYLTVSGPTDLHGILAHVRAPALRSVRLLSSENEGYRQVPIGPDIYSFLQESPLVEYLELYDIDLSPEYFASCFSLLTNLQELRLHESSISNATLKLLYAPQYTSELRFCPKLARVDFRWCGHLEGKYLVDLVCSRLSSVDNPAKSPSDIWSPIAEVTAMNCCYVEERDIVELARTSVCRVVVRETDHCYRRHCCDNQRYRLRLKYRHFAELSPEQRSSLKLIL